MKNKTAFEYQFCNQDITI